MSEDYGSWDRVEQGIFEVLCARLDSQPGVDAFRLDDRPRSLTADDEEHVEWVLVTGGGAVEAPPQRPGDFATGRWEMNAEIAVRGVKASAVRSMAERIRRIACLGPADVPGLARFWWVTSPDMQRELAPNGARGSGGEDTIVFYSRIQCKLVFDDTPSEED